MSSAKQNEVVLDADGTIELQGQVSSKELTQVARSGVGVMYLAERKLSRLLVSNMDVAYLVEKKHILYCSIGQNWYCTLEVVLASVTLLEMLSTETRYGDEVRGHPRSVFNYRGRTIFHCIGSQPEPCLVLKSVEYDLYYW